uniref:Uncharacterized protein n=1 Tax=Glossina austeni TaxID=7395 RepID=A0A1A9VF53_GLOAU
MRAPSLGTANSLASFELDVKRTASLKNFSICSLRSVWATHDDEEIPPAARIHVDVRTYLLGPHNSKIIIPQLGIYVNKFKIEFPKKRSPKLYYICSQLKTTSPTYHRVKTEINSNGLNLKLNTLAEPMTTFYLPTNTLLITTN